MSAGVLPILVDRDETARALRCSADVVDRLVAAGRLRPVYLDDADEAPKFRPEDLYDLVEESQTTRTPSPAPHDGCPQCEAGWGTQPITPPHSPANPSHRAHCTCDGCF